MFCDDLWWSVPSEIEIRPAFVEVIPNNPMVLKAERIFKDALRK
jgi:hypothetical protein